MNLRATRAWLGFQHSNKLTVVHLKLGELTCAEYLGIPQNIVRVAVRERVRMCVRLTLCSLIRSTRLIRREKK